jgi:ribosome maturation factor RimP
MEKQATEKLITTLIAPHLLDAGYELVRVALLTENSRLTLQVMAERQDGCAIRVEDCRAITTLLDPVLDQADPIPGAYHLEVSSAGIDRPLTRPKDFNNWVGFEAKVTLSAPHEGRKNFRGLLRGLENDKVLMLCDGVEIGLPLALVAKAQLVLSDALIKATAQREAEAAAVIAATTKA